MASLAYFPLYPKDFLGATGRLTAEKFGIYTRLLFASWIEPLKNDQKELKILTGTSHKKTLEILERFFVLKDGVWVNERLERERVKAVKKHEIRVEKATKAAEARWNATSNAPSNAQAYPQAMPTQNSEPITHNKEPIKREKRKRFTPPLYVDVVKQMMTGKNALSQSKAETEAQKFIDFYTSKGWMVGKNKMVSWQASVGTWLSRLDPEPEPFNWEL